MSDFTQMHVFFFVTTIAVVLFMILGIAVAVRVLRILKKVDTFSAMVNEEGKEIREDIAAIREDFREGKTRLGNLIAFANTTRKKRRHNP